MKLNIGKVVEFNSIGKYIYGHVLRFTADFSAPLNTSIVISIGHDEYIVSLDDIYL